MSIRVLVFDRSKQTEHAVKSIVNRLGYEVITASSSALAVFLTRKNFPSLVVVDTRKEDDQTEFLSELNADKDLSAIPVVVVCAPEHALELNSMANRLGVQHVLTHPLKEEVLLSAIGPYLKEMKDVRPQESPE